MFKIKSKFWKTIFIHLSLFILLYCFVMSGCEAENPGEPLVNQEPDTYISEASAGITTRITFYGTDKDGFVKYFEFKWADDEDWTETLENEVILDNVFKSQEQVKVFLVRSYDNLGMADPTPAEVALSATNALPETEITGGPEFGQTSGDDVLHWRDQV